MLQKIKHKELGASKRPLIDPLLQSAITNVVGTRIFWMILDELEKEEKIYEACKEARRLRKKERQTA